MKLFTNQLRKIQFLFLLAFIVIEIICFVILYISYKPLFLQVYNQSREITMEKTRAITHTLSQIFVLSFHRYIHDLKLIGKHMSFLANNEINNNSQFYQNLINDVDKIVGDTKFDVEAETCALGCEMIIKRFNGDERSFDEMKVEYINKIKEKIKNDNERASSDNTNE